MNEYPSKIDLAIIKEFTELIPPGTVVWSDRRRSEYGTTVGGKRIYIQVDRYVMVKDVNGIAGSSGLWLTNEVIIK